jgi:hypothetical protein
VNGYDYVLTAAAAHVVLGSAKKLRQEILAELDCLAREPFAEPDLVETGSFATQNVEVLSDFHFSLPLTFTRA